eukprot:TRINITY_DN6598_c0_g1_i1.p1 TRINITY_DN6598_c0_g1~~TRINITY_DN6598_c0_g1_i1.p1  ORF type:complete len:657 (+),score=150.16 TRINITY_DN6598_c0_g1_i1:41-1972(+)
MAALASLTDLPDELLPAILGSLDPVDIFSVRVTCKRMHAICSDKYTWMTTLQSARRAALQSFRAKQQHMRYLQPASEFTHSLNLFVFHPPSFETLAAQLRNSVNLQSFSITVPSFSKQKKHGDWPISFGDALLARKAVLPNLSVYAPRNPDTHWARLMLALVERDAVTNLRLCIKGLPDADDVEEDLLYKYIRNSTQLQSLSLAVVRDVTVAKLLPALAENKTIHTLQYLDMADDEGSSGSDEEDDSAAEESGPDEAEAAGGEPAAKTAKSLPLKESLQHWKPLVGENGRILHLSLLGLAVNIEHREFGAALAENNNMLSLSVFDIELRRPTIEALTPFLRKTATLQKFMLVGHRYGAQMCRAIASILTTNTAMPLSSLTLAGFGSTSKRTVEVITAASNRVVQLKHLFLALPEVGTEAVQALTSHMSGHPAVESFTMVTFALTDADGIALLRWAQTCPSLHTLQLSGTFTGSGVVSMLNIAAQMTQLRTFGIGGILQHHEDEIDMAVVSALGKLKQLEALLVSGSIISGDSAQYLTHVLTSLPQLKRIWFGPHKLVCEVSSILQSYDCHLQQFQQSKVKMEDDQQETFMAMLLPFAANDPQLEVQHLMEGFMLQNSGKHLVRKGQYPLLCELNRQLDLLQQS